MIETAGLNTGYDVTGKFKLDQHEIEGTIPGTDKPFSCDYDKYIQFDDYAVATTEITGSQLYLNDKGPAYPGRSKGGAPTGSMMLCCVLKIGSCMLPRRLGTLSLETKLISGELMKR